MNEPQVWTVIGVLAATLVGTLTFVLGQFQRTMTIQFTSFRNEMAARFEAVDVRFQAIDVRFDSIDRRLDSLDRDVDALTKHAFGTDRG